MGSNATDARQKCERAFHNTLTSTRDCEAIGDAIAIQQDQLLVLRAPHLPAKALHPV
jgi:hypothetical protein